MLCRCAASAPSRSADAAAAATSIVNTLCVTNADAVDFDILRGAVRVLRALVANSRDAGEILCQKVVVVFVPFGFLIDACLGITDTRCCIGGPAS